MTDKPIREANGAFPRSLSVIAGLMVLFGVAEIVTGFRHSFFGISTSAADLFTTAAVTIGAGYAVAGVLILTTRRWAAMLAIILLVLVVGGRIAIVAAGLYPLDSAEQVIAIFTGTGIAVLFAIYIGLRFSSFRS